MLQVYERAYRLYVVTYKICQMLQSWDKLLSSSTSTEIHRDCGITYCTIKRKVILSNVNQKCGPLPPGSAVNLNKLNLIEIVKNLNLNALWSLVFSTTRPWNKQISAPNASQPSSQEQWQVADLKHLKTSYIFSLPRISTKDFPYIKAKIDRSTGINYSSVNFKWTQVFLCCQLFDCKGQWIF